MSDTHDIQQNLTGNDEQRAKSRTASMNQDAKKQRMHSGQMGAVGNVPAQDAVKKVISEHNQNTINDGTDSSVNESGESYFKLLLQTIALAVVFCVQFSAFNGAQNMISQIYGFLGYGSLGNYTLGILYFAFGIVCLFVGNVEQMLHYKYIMFIGSFGYNAFLAAGFLLAYCNNENLTDGICATWSIYFFCMLGATLCGCGASIIWTAQGGYINAIGARMKSKEATFFGLFWAINQSSMIIGSALGSLIFAIADVQTYFLVFTIMGVAAEFCFLALPNQPQKMKPPAERDSIGESVKRFWHLLTHKDTRALLPFLCLTGVNVAFFSGFLHELVVATQPKNQDEDETNQKLTYIFITLGAAEIVTGLFIGKITELSDNYTLARIGTIIVQIALLLSLIGVIVNSFELCFVIAAVWGVADCFFNSHACTMCAADFSGIIEIFAVFRFCLAMSVFASQLIQIGLKETGYNYPYIIYATVFQIVTNYSCSFLKKPEEFGEKKEEKEQVHKE